MRVKLLRPYKALGRMWLPGEVIDLPVHLAQALILEESGECERKLPETPEKIGEGQVASEPQPQKAEKPKRGKK